jgi:hypothetical protein
MFTYGGSAVLAAAHPGRVGGGAHCLAIRRFPPPAVTGKTTLAQSLDPDRTFYVNCDLPNAEDMVRDPALFYRNCPKPVVVFDEIHQLRDPSRVLDPILAG